MFHPLIKAKSQRWNSAMDSISLHPQKHAKILTCKSQGGGDQNYLNYLRVAIKSRIDIPYWILACRIKKHFFSSNAEKIRMLTYFSRKHDWSSSQNALRISTLLFHRRRQNYIFVLLNFCLLHVPICRLPSTSDHQDIMQVIQKMGREDNILLNVSFRI